MGRRQGIFMRIQIGFATLLFVSITWQIGMAETTLSVRNKDHEPDDSVAIGKELFRQDFGEYKGYFLGGDGLGPMFNGRSCVECHHQGGEGGGGGLKHNVDIVTVTDRTLSEVSNAALTALHSGFTDSGGEFVPAIVLHQFSTDPRYAEARRMLLGNAWTKVEDDEAALAKMLKRNPHRLLNPAGQAYLIHSQRNTPALFGIGLIEQVPDELIVEQQNRKKRFGVRGRVSQVADDQIGRFGWRAQLPDLREFVLSACANELGLEVEGHSQTANPLEPTSRLASAEVSKGDSDAIIEFVASIESPTVDYSQVSYETAFDGMTTFSDIGCSECHVRHMGPARNVFSDLLLHDMGDHLSDPLGASPEIETITRANPTGEGTRTFFEAPRTVNVYYVGTVLTQEVRTEPNHDDPYTDVMQRFAVTNVDRRNEWRTPPLWGCADSSPYMHDGRSATLHEAIIAHGGEATQSRARYNALKPSNREKLLAFLGSLKAPSAVP